MRLFWFAAFCWAASFVTAAPLVTTDLGGAEFTPLGWSLDGKFAYLLANPIENFVITDTVEDRVLNATDSGPDEAQAGQIPKRTDAVKFYARLLNLQGIRTSKPGTFQPFPLADGPLTLDASATLVNGAYEVRVSRGLRSKLVTKLDAAGLTDVRVVGAVRSPWEDRLALVVVTSAPVTVHVFGCLVAGTSLSR